jgi:hypothetical protein
MRDFDFVWFLSCSWEENRPRREERERMAKLHGRVAKD